MDQQFTNYLLLSLGAAINFPVLAIVLNSLYLPQGAKKTTYFLVGSEIILLLIGAIALFWAPQVIDLDIRSKLSKSIDLYIGIILLALAAYNFFRKPSGEESKPIREMSDWRYFLYGAFLMIANVNTLIMFISVLKNIIQMSDQYLPRVTLLVLSSIIINLMIIIPLIFYLVSPELTNKILAPINQFVQKNRKNIITIVLLLLSVLLLYRGLVN